MKRNTDERVSASTLEKWIETLFAAFGVSKEQAVSVSQNMVWSELVERQNFGVSRIPIHVRRLHEGVLNPQAEPDIEVTGPTTAVVDGDNAFGHHAGKIGMEKAIALAKAAGVGVVTVKQSNWYGTGAYFVKLAADEGLIGLALSNSFPKVVAHGGTLPVFGTNPFAFGSPRENGDHILVDFATSSLAGSTVRQYLAEGKEMPEGLAVMPDGSPLTDPARIGEGSLTPFGGAKGFGIGLMVEILSGVLSGSGFSKDVKSTYSNFDEKSDSGHCLVAIDPSRFMTMQDFFERMELLVAMIRASAGEGGDVRLPGEIRWQNLRRNERIGIEIPDSVLDELQVLATKAGVQAFGR